MKKPDLSERDRVFTNDLFPTVRLLARLARGREQ